MHFCDTHVHLWDEANLPPWLADDPALSPIASTHDIARYVREAGAGLTSAVYLEVDVAPVNRRREAEWIMKVCEDPSNPLRGAVIGAPIVDGSVQEFAEWVAEWAPSPFVKGVRQVLHVQPAGTVLREDIVSKARICGENGLIFELCMRCDDLADVAALAKQECSRLAPATRPHARRRRPTYRRALPTRCPPRS